MNQYNDSPDCIANRLVRDVLGMKVKWFNQETSRWRLGTIIRIERGMVTLRARDKSIQWVGWGFVIMPKGEAK